MLRAPLVDAWRVVLRHTVDLENRSFLAALTSRAMLEVVAIPTRNHTCPEIFHISMEKREHLYCKLFFFHPHYTEKTTQT